MPKISPELTAAIKRMSADKKDKLLLRLIAKDKILLAQLHFELIEDKSTVEDRVEALQRQITSELKEVETYYFTPGNLLMAIRALNARITKHVKITKDKLSDVTLTLFLLSEPIRLYSNRLSKFSMERSRTLAEYYIRRVQVVLNKAAKLHEDYHLEFKADLQKVLDFIHQYKPTASLAKEVGIPRFWE